MAIISNKEIGKILQGAVIEPYEVQLKKYKKLSQFSPEVQKILAVLSEYPNFLIDRPNFGKEMCPYFMESSKNKRIFCKEQDFCAFAHSLPLTKAVEIFKERQSAKIRAQEKQAAKVRIRLPLSPEQASRVQAKSHSMGRYGLAALMGVAKGTAPYPEHISMDLSLLWEDPSVVTLLPASDLASEEEPLEAGPASFSPPPESGEDLLQESGPSHSPLPPAGATEPEAQPLPPARAQPPRNPLDSTNPFAALASDDEE